MKRLIILVLLFTLNLVHAQQKVLYKIILSDVTINGVNASNKYLEENGYLVFYVQEDGSPALANVMVKSETQSYGNIFSIQNDVMEEGTDNYKAEMLKFKWGYVNSYNNKSGTASIDLLKVYKPQGIVCILTMVLENLNVLVFKGYEEGSLNINKYSTNI